MDREMIFRALAMHAAMMQATVIGLDMIGSSEEASKSLTAIAEANFGLIKAFAEIALTKPVDPFS